jgi:hypothetical protein
MRRTDTGQGVRVADECAHCGSALTAEEIQDPEQDADGGLLCSWCWDCENMDACDRCEGWFEKSELESKPGEIIAVWRTAPGWHSPVRRGYYRVKEWPFYADGMVEGYFRNDALDRIGPLDPTGRRRRWDVVALAGAMCAECQDEVRAVIAARRQPAALAWVNAPATLPEKGPSPTPADPS